MGMEMSNKNKTPWYIDSIVETPAQYHSVQGQQCWQTTPGDWHLWQT